MKKVVSLLVVAVIIVGMVALVGCGGSGGELDGIWNFVIAEYVFDGNNFEYHVRGQDTLTGTFSIISDGTEIEFIHDSGEVSVHSFERRDEDMLIIMGLPYTRAEESQL